MEGLVESTRFGFSTLGTVQPDPSTGPVIPQYQSGLPPSGIRFGRKIYGSTTGAISNSQTSPQYQSGLPDNALRFGFKPLGTVAATPISGAGTPKFQSGLPPNLLRFGHIPFGTAATVVTTTPPTQSGDPGGYAGARRAIAEGRRAARLAREAALREQPAIVPATEVPVAAPKEVKQQLTVPELQPLPINFGGVPSIIGIRRKLTDEIEQQLEADDEEAIIAIILAALK